jgi:Tfp pilus assembly protein PilV
MTCRRVARTLRRGASLIEAVAVVLVLAISVPPTIAWMDRAASRRLDSIQIIRATNLVASVLDQVLSDASTADVGLDPAAYLDTPTTGLRARLTTLTTPDQTVGITYQVSFGPLVASTLATTNDPTRDLYRLVTVSASYTDSIGIVRTLPITAIVSKP